MNNGFQNGNNRNPAPVGGGFLGGKGKKRPAPRPPVNPGLGLFGGGLPAGGGQIISIEKIYNCVIYDKFMNEFKRMIRKYSHKSVDDILLHLFHGTNQTDPKMIYASEDGFDIRFSNAGAYGNGIYFANNACYSNSFTHRKANGECQMFLANVLIGDSVNLPGG